MKYYVSFVEECVMNSKYLAYIAGRIEVHEFNKPFSCHEIRFFTKRIRAFEAFRRYWDMKDVTEKQLKYVEGKVERDFCQFPKK